MLRSTARAAAWAGWALLGAAALAGLVLSLVAVLAALPVARTWVASAVVRIADEALAGRLELERIEVLPRGGIELRGLRVLDPDGHLVLAVGRARVAVDVTALRARTIGVEVELDAPSILLDEEEDGGLSIARAFAPSRPAGPPPPGGRGDGGGGGAGPAWTVELSRVSIHGGEVWWVDQAGATRLEADRLEVEARGRIGPRRLRAEVRVRGELREPVASPVAIDLLGSREEDAVRISVLEVEAGDTELSAVGEGDLARRRGRLAVGRLGLSRAQVRALAPSAPQGEDLGASGYAESDGATITAALRVEPVTRDGRGGRGDAAIAGRLGALRRAWGFDVALDRLDPARLTAAAPPGEVTLTARGAVAGTSLDDAAGRLSLSVSRSRLRRGELTRAEVQLRVAHGTVELERLSASAPGVVVSGAGRWQRRGPVAGSAGVDAQDLEVASRNLAQLLGGAAPALAGRVRLAAELTGTSAAPALAGTVDAPSLRSGAAAAEGLRLAVRAEGPLGELQGRADGRIAIVRGSGGRELASRVALHAAVRGEDGSLSASASVPGAGREPLAVEARGRLGARRETLQLVHLGLSWPGTRWALVRPAAVNLRGPSVDRLDLAADVQQVSVSGGMGPRGALAVRVELSRLDLARLPPGALRPEDRLAGEVSATLDASGTAARPVVSGRIAVANGAWRDLSGLGVVLNGSFDGGTRRAAASLSVARASGGTVDATVELPVPLAGRPGEPVSARIRAAALPVADLLAAAGGEDEAEVAGTLALDVTVGGSAGAPSLAGEASLSDGAWHGLDGLGASVALEHPGSRVRITGSAFVAGRRVLGVEAEVPIDLGDLVDRPAETLRAVQRAPLKATAHVTSLDLASIAGRAGIPRGIAGVVDGQAALTGSAAAPRGAGTVDLTGGAWGGWRRVGAHLELAANERGLSAGGTVTAAGQDALRFQASLGILPERLGRRDALGAAPLRAEAVIPRIALAPAAGEALPLSGTLEGRLAASGTPRAPEVTLDVTGTGVAIEGRPLGDAHATARYAARRTDADVVLRPRSGGTLRAALSVSADLGLGAQRGALGDAPAEVSAVAEDLDLGFLAAVAPGTIRSAGGKLALDVRSSGPLARLSPRGTAHLEKGRLGVAELGEWTDIALDARVTDEAVELSRLELRRGAGRLSASGALRGVRSETAKLSGKLAAEAFTISRAGMDLATLDLSADASGTWHAGELAVELNVPRGVVRLPRKTPRTLQSLEARKDIVIGRRPEKKQEASAPGPASGRGPGFSLQAHLVVPHNLFVKSDSPKLDVELKADVRYELTGGQDYAEGSVEVVRGSVEPIAGRNFVLERGRVQFTGGPPKAALLDVEAKYQNPAAVVTVNVSGAASAPEIRLSSQPPMDEAQIAMLVATGRTELKAGSGAVGTLTGEEAGKAALGALATQAFRNLVQDKLPLDTVALDSGSLRAGKYWSDKIYFGYVRRFDADPTKYENEDEVRMEYQITPRWMLESRYGNAGTGGANLIWSREY